MSGHSYVINCPNCQQHMDVFQDSKPFDQTSCSCNHCGFYTVTKADFINLSKLNEQRLHADFLS